MSFSGDSKNLILKCIHTLLIAVALFAPELTDAIQVVDSAGVPVPAILSRKNMDCC